MRCLHRRHLGFEAAGLIFVIAARSSASPAAPGFYPLGDLPGGVFYSHGLGLSADGSVAVGVSESTSGPEAFRRTLRVGMVGLGDLPDGGFNSEARGVSADGTVIVGDGTAASQVQAFRWTAGTGMVPITGAASASDVSADGSVIVGRRSDAFEAYRWTDGTGVVGLGDLPGGNFNSTAVAVSADGNTVVGFSLSGSGTEAFRWTSATGMVGLGDLPDGTFRSQARGVSGDGSVVVGFGIDASGFLAFRWTAEGGMVSLGSETTFGKDISADGTIIAGDGINGPFVWDETHGVRFISSILGVSFSDWQFLSVEAISDDGSTIIGSGRHLIGEEEAWIAVLPEPATGLTLSTFGALLAGWRARR